ncbi:hypothetical protein [Streptomyces sp. AM6-12]|uniref:hypothetical protein n=1 Tax=Streptomyces sp. AM6-12 TaxID=3345149 RepID=UPI0037BC2E1A
MTYRRIGSRSGAARRSWAAVLTLLAALVVLVHHDVGPVPTAPATPITTMTAISGMSGMAHTAHRAAGHQRHTAALTSAMGHGMDHDMGGACSGAQHCSSGAIGSPQWIAPPTVPVHTIEGAPPGGVLAGRGLPGNPHRAPPDLSRLSRLLI